MGLKKAITNVAGGAFNAAGGSISTVLGDQWKEYFYCDSMESDVLVVKGQKRTSDRSSNKKGADNIITNGSVIAVNEGQCMIIVEQGKIVDVCAEPGQFIYDTSTEPSIFSGSLGDSIKNTFKTIGKRFTFGGDTGMDQRIYYFNTKEIGGNKYGTPNPIGFKIVDKNIGFDMDTSLRCNGLYSYKIVDPLLFYANVCGNVVDSYTRDKLDEILRSEIIHALQPALGKISMMGIRYSELSVHTDEIADALNEELSKKWTELRGIVLFSITVNGATIPPEDQETLKKLQATAVFRNADMAAANLAGAQAEAMKAAASNENGAMMGFMGMNMAQAAGGMNTQDLFAIGQQQRMQQQQMQQQQMQQQMQQQQQPAPQAAPTANNTGSWSCSCGASGNTGKFCMECGKPKPEDDSWTCSCGAVNKGKFCAECGKPKPAAVKMFKCNKCGWEPADPTNPPKFCPECGDIFDLNDVK